MAVGLCLLQNFCLTPCILWRLDTFLLKKGVQLGMSYPSPIQNLINEFNKLPGIGPKTAERFVFYLLSSNPQNLLALKQALENLKERILVCSLCQNYSEKNLCQICNNPKRDKNKVCLVVKPQDIIALEKTNEYNGIYYVLGNTLQPLEGIGPEQLNLKELLKRLGTNSIKEIILALNPDLEGEATMIYLTQLLKKYKIKITRLARGLPRGSDLEYVDPVTLADALKGRLETL